MLDDDGLILDEVGEWAEEKHARLRKYVDISRAVRRKFIQRGNGATYIDLYCGAGRAIIRNTLEKIDGSPLVAVKCARNSNAAFSQVYIADESEERCLAAESRLKSLGSAPRAEIGKVADTVRRIASRLSPYDLHFAFLDPYNLEDLPFEVIEMLSKLKHMDILIHVSAQDLQRNLDPYSAAQNGPLDVFAPGWRNEIDLNQTQRAIRAAFLQFWASKIERLGMASAERAELVSGPVKNQRLYWLVFVSRHERAREFWNKIRNISRQGELFDGA